MAKVDLRRFTWYIQSKLNIFVEAGKIAVPLRFLNHSLVLSYQEIKVYANKVRFVLVADREREL